MILVKARVSSVFPKKTWVPCYLQSSIPFMVEKARQALPTVFENDRKSIIQHCERCNLRLHFE